VCKSKRVKLKKENLAQHNSSVINRTQAVQVFKSIPSFISFEKYMIGKVYETRLEIRNTSLNTQQFKIMPPKTEYFSLSLGKCLLNHIRRHFHLNLSYVALGWVSQNPTKSKSKLKLGYKFYNQFLFLINIPKDFILFKVHILNQVQ
jgi:hypothetical protein